MIFCLRKKKHILVCREIRRAITKIQQDKKIAVLFVCRFHYLCLVCWRFYGLTVSMASYTITHTHLPAAWCDVIMDTSHSPALLPRLRVNSVLLWIFSHIGLDVWHSVTIFICTFSGTVYSGVCTARLYSSPWLKCFFFFMTASAGRCLTVSVPHAGVR